MALWGGRFEGGVATSTQEFGASLPVDKHLYNRLHTGRSRNDQVATDTRLAVKALTKDLMEANLNLRHVLVEAAEANKKAILPGMTHLQHAQPVLFSPHLLA